MSGINWATDQQIQAVSVVPATRVTAVTPVLSSVIDPSAYAPNSRLQLVLSATGVGGGSTGGTWSITESATSGGTYAAAAGVHGSLAATTAAATTTVRSVSINVNPAKPFVKAVFTGADSSTATDIAATLLVVPNAVL
jgi:hypothetical protein